MSNSAMLTLVADLRRYDHAFLNQQGADRFSKGFGVPVRTSVVKANPRDPKGLTLDNGAKSAVGIDACILAQVVCRGLNVKYDEKFGRGSQLRACCDALEAHFSK